MIDPATANRGIFRYLADTRAERAPPPFSRIEVASFSGNREARDQRIVRIAGEGKPAKAGTRQ